MELDAWEKRHRRIAFTHGWIGASLLGMVLLALCGDLTACLVWVGVSLVTALLIRVRLMVRRRDAARSVPVEGTCGQQAAPATPEDRAQLKRLNHLWHFPTEDEPKENA